VGALKKKTYNLDEDLIERARRALDAKTDTDAINRALQRTVDEREIEQRLEALLRAGRFRTLYR
jgi:Arc/MetJ family transcription regulator